MLTLAGALVGSVPMQLINGVETGLALAAVAWMLSFLSEPAGSRLRRYGAPLLCGLLPYVRPDLSALSLAAFAMLAVGRLRSQADRRAALRGILADLAIAVAAALPFALWYLRDLGTLFPSTVMAKRYFHAEAAMPLGVKLSAVLKSLGRFTLRIGIVVLLVPLLALRPAGRAGILFFLLFVTTYALQFPTALMFNEYRYMMPMVPVIMLAGACAFRSGTPALRAAASAILAATLLLVVVDPGLSEPSVMDRAHRPRFRIHLRLDNWYEYQYCCGLWSGCNRATCLWCEENLPKDATVLIHDAGAISFYTHLHLVDVVGLKTPASVEAHRRFTYPSMGLRRGDAVNEIATNSHCGYYVAMGTFDGPYHILEGLLAHGWTADVIFTNCDYTVYRLVEPPAGIASLRRGLLARRSLASRTPPIPACAACAGLADSEARKWR